MVKSTASDLLILHALLIGYDEKHDTSSAAYLRDLIAETEAKNVPITTGQFILIIAKLWGTYPEIREVMIKFYSEQA